MRFAKQLHVCVWCWRTLGTQNTFRGHRGRLKFTTERPQTMINAGCHRKMGFYLLVLSVAVVLKARPLNPEDKMLLVTAAGSEKLNCFTQALEDFSCFWDEKDSGNSSEYRFFYQYQYEDVKKECPLSTERIVSDMTRYICKFPMMDVSLFAPLDIEVSSNSCIVMSRKDMYINHAVLLDPPSNVTVQQTGKPGQLHVKWSAPQLKYLENSLMYEVNFSSAGSSVQKVEIIKGKTECIILKLKSQTEYHVSIRVKPDGVSMDGYWTIWSKPVSATTVSDLDPLILSLTLVLILIIMLLSLSILKTYHRTIKEKIWPLVPSPENMFDGLFTVYRGNFQEWLGRSSGQIWWNLQFFSTDEPPTVLEVLSEIKTFPPGLAKIRHQDVFLDEQSFLVAGSDALKLQQQTLMDEGKLPVRVQIAPDAKDAYIVLNQNFLPNNTFLSDACGFTHSSNDVSEEALPLQLLFENPGVSLYEDKDSTEEEEEDSSLHASISCQFSESSGIEQGSPVSFIGFDYAKYDPSGQLLYLSPLKFKLESDAYYPYLLMSDSGVSADYSMTDFQSLKDKADTEIYTNLCRRDDHLESVPASIALHSES
ncbi:erythropoietin receptor [Heptranchias perlo]|uniref:erythropoietin receptor n=1 Tax=Heptranchias perlo TaxID=212740 RepID=UPI003559F0B6